jgi:ElaB/YqjD/DUF883 family membrane-anchored ribosome-binding protein
MENRDSIRSGTGNQPTSEWTQSKPRDSGEVTRQHYDEAKEGFKGYASDAKDSVQNAARRTREYVEDTVDQARDKMAEYTEGGFERVKHEVTGYTRNQPMTALLIAAGAGLVLGWLSSIARR